MKIISKYSDYYDSAMGQGIDTSLIYKREGALDYPIESHIRWENDARSVEYTELSGYFGKILNPDYFAGSWWARSNNNVNLQSSVRTIVNGINKGISNKYKVDSCDINIIGFCGKAYVTYRVTFETLGQSGGLPYNHAMRYAHAICTKASKFLKPLSKKQLDRIIIGEVDDIFRGNIDDIFLHFDCPIFLISPVNYFTNGIQFIRNPILKDLGFPAILDPYTAFQEISMYMGSVFAKAEPSMENISDKSMTEAKGFDKWSFRKLPTKKR